MEKVPYVRLWPVIYLAAIVEFTVYVFRVLLDKRKVEPLAEK